MRFPSLASFANYLSGALQFELGAAQRRGLTQACLVIESEAKAAIGTYRYNWPRLSPATVARKGADTPLLQTGQMRDSITHEVSNDGRAVVYTDDPKAVYHELGTARIPPRPFLSRAAIENESEAGTALAEPVLAALAGSNR